MDRRFLRSISTFSVLLLGVILVRVTVYFLTPYLGDFVRTQAAGAGTKLDYDTIDLNFPLNLEMKGVNTVIPVDVRGLQLNVMGMPLQSVPIPLHFESVFARVRLLPLVIFSPTVDMALTGYNGTTSGEFHSSLFSSSRRVSITADALQLGTHPAATLAGIDGILGLKLNAEFSGPIDGQGELDATISRGSFRGGQVALVQIPQVTGLNLRFSAKKNDGKISIEKCSLSSSLGSASCTGTFELNPKGAIEKQNFNLELALTGPGLKSLGSWLNLFAQLPPDQSNPNWTLSIVKEPKRQPVVKLTPKTV